MAGLVHLVGDVRERRRRRGDVAVAELPGEGLPDRRGDRVERDPAGDRRETAEERGVRHRAADVLERELGGGNRAQALRPEPARELADAELVEAAPGVD